MKINNRFLIAFLVFTILFSGLSAVVSALGFSTIQQNSRNAIAQIIAQVKEKYPEVSDDDIIKILNGTQNIESAEKLISKYGINNSDWVVLKNKGTAELAIVLITCVCGFSCLTLCGVFVIYCRKNRSEMQKITDYVSLLNHRQYNLMIEENSEDDLSLLKNEIYKTTVMLKEQTEISQKDKENLKESLSDISHQLKTPLTSMLIMLDNINDDEHMPDEIRRDFLNDIRRETASISFLVQSILTLSKLDANSIVLKSQPESIGKILNMCKKNMEVLAELKNVEVSAECADNVLVSCDSKWMCEALTNIVKNCIEHTSDGGHVHLKAEQNKLYTKITISDNGCGIDKADLPHIFERFYKGKNSSENSVGIGLALAKTIIEKSNGYITVESQIDKGTTFEIKFFAQF